VSETDSVSVLVPAATGTPEINPDDGFSVSPVCNVPLVIDHVYDPLPPTADRLALYGTPTEPTDSVLPDGCVIVSGEYTVIDMIFMAGGVTPLLSDKAKVTLAEVAVD